MNENIISITMECKVQPSESELYILNNLFVVPVKIKLCGDSKESICNDRTTIAICDYVMHMLTSGSYIQSIKAVRGAAAIQGDPWLTIRECKDIVDYIRMYTSRNFDIFSKEHMICHVHEMITGYFSKKPEINIIEWRMALIAVQKMMLKLKSTEINNESARRKY